MSFVEKIPTLSSFCLLFAVSNWRGCRWHVFRFFYILVSTYHYSVLLYLFAGASTTRSTFAGGLGLDVQWDHCPILNAHREWISTKVTHLASSVESAIGSSPQACFWWREFYSVPFHYWHCMPLSSQLVLSSSTINGVDVEPLYSKSSPNFRFRVWSRVLNHRMKSLSVEKIKEWYYAFCHTDLEGILSSQWMSTLRTVDLQSAFFHFLGAVLFISSHASFLVIQIAESLWMESEF